MRFDHPVRTPLLWLITSLIVFGWPGRAPAARPEPCSVQVMKAMSDSGLSGYEAERVCYYATRYLSQNQTLPRAEALFKALRRLGLAQDPVLEKISTALSQDERAMLKLNQPKRTAPEPKGEAKVEWELRSSERDPLDEPEIGWYKVDQHALFDPNPSDPIGELREDLDLMLKLKVKF